MLEFFESEEEEEEELLRPAFLTSVVSDVHGARERERMDMRRHYRQASACGNISSPRGTLPG